VFDREFCLLYKAAMDELIDPDASAIAMHTTSADPPGWKLHGRSKDDEKKLLDRFRDPADPLQFVIVTSKLLTGFDAPKDALLGLVVLVRLRLHFHLPANEAHGSIDANSNPTSRSRQQSGVTCPRSPWIPSRFTCPGLG